MTAGYNVLIYSTTPPEIVPWVAFPTLLTDYTILNLAPHKVNFPTIPDVFEQQPFFKLISEYEP